MLCSFRKHASTIKTVIVFKGGRKRPNKSNRRFALWRQSVYINFHIAKAPHDLASGPSHTPYLIRRYGDTAIRRYGDTPIPLGTTCFSKLAPSTDDRYSSPSIQPVFYFRGGEEWVANSNRQTKKSHSKHAILFVKTHILHSIHIKREEW